MKNVVVHTPTQQQSKELRAYWAFKGAKWHGGQSLLDTDTAWYSYRSSTCYGLYDNKVSFGAQEHFYEKAIPFDTYKSEVIDKDEAYQAHLKGNVQNMHETVKKTDDLDYGKQLPIRCEFKNGDHYLTMVRYADELAIAHDLKISDATEYAMEGYQKKYGLAFDGKRILSNYNHKGHKLVEVHEFKKALDGYYNTTPSKLTEPEEKTVDCLDNAINKLKEAQADKTKLDDYKSLYESAIAGRQEFRDAYRRERDKVKELEQKLSELTDETYWTKLHHQAAIAAMQGLMPLTGGKEASAGQFYWDTNNIAIQAREQATTLIEKLKGK